MVRKMADHEPLAQKSLFESIMRGDPKGLELAIRTGAQPMFRDHSDTTPLGWACTKGNEQVIEILAAHCPFSEFFHANKYGCQPVHLACIHGQAEVIELLVEKGAKLDTPTKLGKMPMHLAAHGGFPEVVAAICGCIRSTPSCVDNTLQMVLKNRLDVTRKPGDMEKLVKKVCELRDNQSRSPIQVARAAIRRAGDVNGEGGEAKATTHVSVVQVLLQNGADNELLPPLTAAECAAPDEDGIPAPYVPPVEFFGEASQREKKTQHKLSAKEMEMYNCLWKIVKTGKTLEVTNLLDKGAGTENRDEFGNTALICAAQNGNRRMIKLLLRYGADPDAKNKAGNTPLHYCKEYHFDECYDYLISKGADPLLKNFDGVPASAGLSGESVVPGLAALKNKQSTSKAGSKAGTRPSSIATPAKALEGATPEGGIAVTPDTATPPTQPTRELQVGDELITSPEAEAKLSPESPLSPGSPPNPENDEFPAGQDADIHGGSGSEEDPDKDDFAE